jgi:hypothetical protein
MKFVLIEVPVVVTATVLVVVASTQYGWDHRVRTLYK